ncbi:MAG: hypothetical protein AB2808_08845, partial [Candidatus Sedimenticola endophacoides]
WCNDKEWSVANFCKALLAWMLAGPCHWHGLICGAIGPIIGRLRFDEVSWSGGFAWYEMAGGFTTFDQDEFEAIGAAQIDDVLARITLEA